MRWAGVSASLRPSGFTAPMAATALPPPETHRPQRPEAEVMLRSHLASPHLVLFMPLSPGFLILDHRSWRYLEAMAPIHSPQIRAAGTAGRCGLSREGR